MLEPLQILLATSSRRSIVSEFSKKDSIQDSLCGQITSCISLIEARDYEGRTPLHFATRMNNTEHAGILLQYGADVDSPDSLKRTPLMIAIYWNHHDMTNLLLSQGAHTDVVDANKMTSLHYAAKFGDLKTLRILNRLGVKGISPNFRDRDVRLPIEIFDGLRQDYLLQSARTEKSRREFEQLLDSALPSTSYCASNMATLDYFDVLGSVET
ncbi:ankyrin [Penicillium malachiteum]|nr:ankyrin [Penicillium malachiteum]